MSKPEQSIHPNAVRFSTSPEVESWTEAAKANYVARSVLAELATDRTLAPDTRIAAAVALAKVGD